MPKRFPIRPDAPGESVLQPRVFVSRYGSIGPRQSRKEAPAKEGRPWEAIVSDHAVLRMKTKTPKLPTTWEEIRVAVETIIARKTMERAALREGSRRPFGFSDFAREIDFDIGYAFRCVRGKQKPPEPLEIAVREWVEKNNGK